MMVNNEVGTRNDVERLAAEVKRRNSRTIVHVDARGGQLPARTDRIVYHKELLHDEMQQLFSFYSSFASR